MRLFLVILALLGVMNLSVFAGCQRAHQPVPPSPSATPARPAASESPPGVSDTLGVEKAKPSDFTIPLYPSGQVLRSGRTRGLSPQDQEVTMATVEMYSLDSIDDIVRYYRKRKGLTVQDFDTDRGRNVILSDGSGIVLLDDREFTRGTTLVLSRDNEQGRTLMVYTAFLKE